MKTHSDNELLVINYLLGALPEAELERFEGRFLKDEALFEEVQEIEDELIDDYVSGALSVEQRRLFDKYFLRSPQRQQKLKFARSLTEHAVSWKENFESAKTGDAMVSKPIDNAGKVFPFRSWAQPVPAWRQWVAIAAMVLMAVGAATLWLRNRELRRELIAENAKATELGQEIKVQSERSVETSAQLSAEQQQTQKLEDQLEELQKSIAATTARKLIVTTMLGVDYLVHGRGGSEKKVKTVELPPSTGVLRLGLEFEKSRFDTFKIILRRAESGTAWTRGGLKARILDNKQSLSLAVPAANLPAGNYELIVSGVPIDGPAELVGYYFLKVIRSTSDGKGH